MVGTGCCCSNKVGSANHWENMTDNDLSSISEFYAGRSIFVTGATGFIGKVLVEKLLRSCSGITNIYVLLRNKNGQDSRQRLDNITNVKIFERLKKDRPKVCSKLIPISGDITKPGLGISDLDLSELASNVSIVFHGAATVKFDEPLNVAMEANVLSARRVVEVCHHLPLLEALVHVSTAYCNCDRKEVDEIVYPPPVDPQSVIDAIEWMNEDLTSSITSKLLGNRPNTYTFTKALAESLVVEECKGLPLVIIRPSIITGSWGEPLPGWVDNLNGPSGLLVAIGKGIIRTMMLNKTKVADFIPVDFVANLMISVAWFTATERPNNVMVYNCTSGCVNPLKWGFLADLCIPFMQQNPSEQVFRYPFGSPKTSTLINSMCVYWYHYFPAGALDLISLVRGKKPKMIKLYGKVHKALGCLEYFAMNEWTFHCNNVISLRERMCPKDRQVFNFDVRNVDWEEYLKVYLLGIRQYLLKEDASTIPAARKALQRMCLTGQIVNTVLIVAFLRVLTVRSQSMQSLWFFTVRLALRIYASLPIPTLS